MIYYELKDYDQYGENIIQEYIQEKIIRRFSSTSQNVYYKIKSINFKLKIITERK